MLNRSSWLTTGHTYLTAHSILLATCFQTRVPILAVSMEGTARMPNATSPSGNKLPSPCVISIQTTCPANGAANQRDKIPHDDCRTHCHQLDHQIPPDTLA